MLEKVVLLKEVIIILLKPSLLNISVAFFSLSTDQFHLIANCVGFKTTRSVWKQMLNNLTLCWNRSQKKVEQDLVQIDQVESISIWMDIQNDCAIRPRAKGQSIGYFVSARPLKVKPCTLPSTSEGESVCLCTKTQRCAVCVLLWSSTLASGPSHSKYWVSMLINKIFWKWGKVRTERGTRGS